MLPMRVTMSCARSQDADSSHSSEASDSPPPLVTDVSTPDSPKPYSVAGLAHTTQTLTMATSSERYRAFLMHLATALCSHERVAAAPAEVDPADVPVVDGQPHAVAGTAPLVRVVYGSSARASGPLASLSVTQRSVQLAAHAREGDSCTPARSGARLARPRPGCALPCANVCKGAALPGAKVHR